MLFWRFLTTRRSSCPAFIPKVFFTLTRSVGKIVHTVLHADRITRREIPKQNTIPAPSPPPSLPLPVDPERFYLSFQYPPDTTRRVYVWAFTFSHLSSTRVVYAPQAAWQTERGHPYQRDCYSPVKGETKYCGHAPGNGFNSTHLLPGQNGRISRCTCYILTADVRRQTNREWKKLAPPTDGNARPRVSIQKSGEKTAGVRERGGGGSALSPL